MPKYEVTLTRNEWHTITVEAQSQEEAESEAWAILTTVGTEVFEVTGSEWDDATHIEEVKND